MQVLETAEGVVRIVVRIIGIVLVLVGAWIGISTIDEAWGLYRDPERVERFSIAIERGSGIDSTLAAAGGTADRDAAGFRPSYFLSWVVAILLLLLIARVAVWMIATGGRLTLHESRLRLSSQESARRSSAGDEA